jgi:hypothetical protein
LYYGLISTLYNKKYLTICLWKNFSYALILNENFNFSKYPLAKSEDVIKHDDRDGDDKRENPPHAFFIIRHLARQEKK